VSTPTIPRTIDISGHRCRVSAYRGSLSVRLTQDLTRECGHHDEHDTDSRRATRQIVKNVTTRLAREHGLVHVEIDATMRGAQPWTVDAFEILD
jgi:hypothetical protein